jgi:cytoskeletal protein RodZ
MAEYDADGWQQVLDHEPDRAAEDAHSAASDGAPEPWYRNRFLLALWALMVALLLTLVIYGMVELSRGGGETSGPTTSTSSTTPTRSSTSTTTPSTPSTTPPSSTTEAPPPESPQPETPEQTPEEAPPPANDSPSPAPPTRHHHHLHLPHFS